jgi:predicted metalloendopeptidase
MFDDIQFENDDKVVLMIKKVACQKQKPGSVEEKIATYYSNILKVGERDYSPIKPYLYMIRKVTTMDAFFDLELKLARECALTPVFSLAFGMTIEMKLKKPSILVSAFISSHLTKRLSTIWLK